MISSHDLYLQHIHKDSSSKWGHILRFQVDVSLGTTMMGVPAMRYRVPLGDDENILKLVVGAPLWHSRLRNWHCRCSSSSHCCSAGSIPGLGTSTCCGCGQKKKKTIMVMVARLYGYTVSCWIFYCLLFIFFRAAPATYGSSWAGAKLELQLLAYITVTAMSDLSHICNLCCSFWQCGILNPLSEATDQTHVLMGTSQVLNLLSQNRNSLNCLL